MDRKRSVIFLFTPLVIISCVKDDPTITGKREDGGVSNAADARPPVVLLAAQDDGPDEDSPECRRCGETLSTSTARGTLCRKNAPISSAALLNNLVDCLCFDKCVAECGTYCAGSSQTPLCGTCVLTQCGEQVTACSKDQK